MPSIQFDLKVNTLGIARTLQFTPRLTQILSRENNSQRKWDPSYIFINIFQHAACLQKPSIIPRPKRDKQTRHGNVLQTTKSPEKFVYRSVHLFQQVPHLLEKHTQIESNPFRKLHLEEWFQSLASPGSIWENYSPGFPIPARVGFHNFFAPTFEAKPSCYSFPPTTLKRVWQNSMWLFGKNHKRKSYVQRLSDLELLPNFSDFETISTLVAGVKRVKGLPSLAVQPHSR